MQIRGNKELFQTKENGFKRNKMFKWAYWLSTAQKLEKTYYDLLMVE